jgi:hypothetical protein
MNHPLKRQSRARAKAAAMSGAGMTTAIITASALLIATLLIVPVFAQSSDVPAATTQATQSVVRDQLEAFRAGDHSRAYSHAAPNIKNYFTTLEHFVSMVRDGYQPIYEPETFVMGRNITYNGEVYQEVIVTDKFGKEWQAVYTLKQQENGSWKVTGVKLEPYKGASV